MSKWNQFWQGIGGIIVSAVLTATAIALCFVPGVNASLTALAVGVGIASGSILISAAIAGYQSYTVGKGFWRGFERYICSNWAQALAITALLFIVAVGISTIATAIRNARLRTYKLHRKSIRLAKKGNPSWETFRKRVWKNEAIYNKSAYSDKQLEKMIDGLAPLVDGKPMHLHHVYGKANDMYTVVKLTQPQHILFHRKHGYHVNKSWNWKSIISLFG